VGPDAASVEKMGDCQLGGPLAVSLIALSASVLTRVSVSR